MNTTNICRENFSNSSLTFENGEHYDRIRKVKKKKIKHQKSSKKCVKNSLNIELADLTEKFCGLKINDDCSTENDDKTLRKIVLSDTLKVKTKSQRDDISENYANYSECLKSDNDLIASGNPTVEKGKNLSSNNVIGQRLLKIQELHNRIIKYRANSIKVLENLRRLDPRARAELKVIETRASIPNVVCICCNRLLLERSMIKGEVLIGDDSNTIKNDLNKSISDSEKVVEKIDLYSLYNARGLILKKKMENQLEYILQDKTEDKGNEQKVMALNKKIIEFELFEKAEFNKKVLTTYPTRRICATCYKNIVVFAKIPRFAISNGLGLPKEIPQEVKTLNFTEQLLVIPYLPFVQMRPMQKHGRNPQFGAKGCVVHVPVDIIFHKHLPITKKEDVYGVVKRCIEHKTTYSEDRIRPDIMMKAMEYLVTTPLYKNEGIIFDRKLFEEYFNGLKEDIQETVEIIEKLNTHDDFVSSKQESEDSECENANGPVYDLHDRDNFAPEAMIIDKNLVKDNPDEIFVLAPGEGKKPKHWCSIPNIIEYVFVTEFGGQPVKTINGVTMADRIKCYTTSVNANLRKPFNILYMAKIYLELRLQGAIHTALKQGTVGKINAKQALDKDGVKDLLKKSNAFTMTKLVRPTPAYFQKAKMDLLAMNRQLGISTLFMTFSPAEGYWVELMQHLVKIHKNENISLEECYNLSEEEKKKMIQMDPSTCCQYFCEKVHNLMLYLKNKNGPFEEYILEDFFIRHEFQMRGSPHIHCIFWLKEAPKYNKDNEESTLQVIKFIDRFISCENTQDKNPYVAFHIHKHTSSCHKGRKHSSVCRFGFPRYPMKDTCILEPLPKEEKTLKIKTDLIAVKKLLENYYYSKTPIEISFDAMLQVLHLSQDEYILAVRSMIKKTTIFLKRRPMDIRINNYNTKLIGLWEGNTDIQFTLDEYALITYVMNYVVKDETGMVKLLHSVIEEATTAEKTLKETYDAVANAFINANFMGAQEAFYICNQLEMIRKSRACVFINTHPAETRTRIMKSKTELEIMDPDATDIYLDGLMEKYEKRTKLDETCLAVWAARYAKSNDIQAEDNAYMKYRIIKFPKVSPHKDQIGYLRQQLVLYFPWRNMANDIDNQDIEELYNTNKERIKKIAVHFNAYEQYDIDEIMEENQRMWEQAQLDSEDEFENNQLSTNEQYNPFGDHDHTENIRKNTNMSEKKNSVQKVYGRLHFQINNEELHHMLGQLNDEQRNIVMHIYSNFKNNIENDLILLIGPAGTGKSFVINTIYQLITQFFDKKGPIDKPKVLLTAPTGKASFLIGGVTVYAAFNFHPTFFKPLSDEDMADIRIEYENVKLVIIDEVSLLSSDILGKIDLRMKQIFLNSEPFAGRAVLLVGDFRQLKPVKGRTIFEQPGTDKNRTKFIGNPLMKKFQVFELTKIERQKGDLEMINALNEMAIGKMSKESFLYFEKRMVSVQEENIKVPNSAIRIMYTNKEVTAYNTLKINKSAEKLYTSISDDKIDLLKTIATKDSIKKIKDNDIKSINDDNEKKKEIIKSLKKYYATKDPNDFKDYRYELKLRIRIRYMVTTNINVKDGLFNGATGVLYRVETQKGGKVKTLWIDFGNNKIGNQARESRLDYINKHQLPHTVVPIERVTVSKKSNMIQYHRITRNQFPVVPAEAMTIHKCQGQTFESACLYMNYKLSRELQYVGCSRVKNIENFYIVGNKFFSTSPIVENFLQIGLKLINQHRPLKLSYETFDHKTGTVISYQNIQGYSNFKKIICDPWYLNSDLIIFSETNVSKKSQICDIPEYNLICSTIRPSPLRSKGILIYGRKSINIKHIDNVSNAVIDLHLLKVNAVFVITGYKSPSATFENFKNAMIKLNKQLSEDDIKIIIGDLNFDCYLQKSKVFLDWVYENMNLKSLLPETVITSDYGSQIDIVLSNHTTIKANVYRTYISDHDVVFCEIPNENDVAEKFQSPIPKHIDLDRKLNSLSNSDIKNIENSKKNKPTRTDDKIIAENLKLVSKITHLEDRTCEIIKEDVGSEVGLKRNIERSEDTSERKNLQIDKCCQTLDILPNEKQISEHAGSSKYLIKLPNVVVALFEGVHYSLYNMCSFNAVLHGFLFALDNPMFKLKDNDPFLKLLKSFSNDIKANENLILDFFIEKSIIQKSFNSRESINMIGSVMDRVDQMMACHISYLLKCSECNSFQHIVRSLAKNFSPAEITFLEEVLKAFPKRKVHCGFDMQFLPQPVFILHSTFNYDKGVELSTIPKDLHIFRKSYKLCFVVGFVPAGKVGHFVSYCLEKNMFWKYDDLCRNAEKLNEDILIWPKTMVYIEKEHTSHNLSKRKSTEPISSISTKKQCLLSDNTNINSEFKIILRNRSEMNYNTKTYSLINMCCFNSISHGLKYAMQQNINVVELDYDYFRMLRSLTSDTEKNLSIVFKFLFKSSDEFKKFSTSNSKNQLKIEVDMFCDCNDMLNIILTNYQSYIRKCRRCSSFETFQKFAVHSLDPFNLGEKINESMEYSNYRCRTCSSTQYSIQISPIVFIDTAFFDLNTNRYIQIPLSRVPNTININGIQFDLSFIVTHFGNHFKAYFKTELNEFIILDDLTNKSQHLRSNELEEHNIYSDLMVYIRKST